MRNRAESLLFYLAKLKLILVFKSFYNIFTLLMRMEATDPPFFPSFNPECIMKIAFVEYGRFLCLNPG